MKPRRSIDFRSESNKVRLNRDRFMGRGEYSPGNVAYAARYFDTTFDAYTAILARARERQPLYLDHSPFVEEPKIKMSWVWANPGV